MERHIYIAKKAQSSLLVVDIQQRLAPAIAHYNEVRDIALQLLSAATLLDVPSVITQQYKQGLGLTDTQIVEHASGATFFDKTHFSACQELDFIDSLASTNRSQVIIVGMEAHVCVLQTALDLLAADFEVFIVADGISSRRDSHKDLAIAQLRQAGAVITCAESVIFQWAERAATPQFKDVLKIVK